MNILIDTGPIVAFLNKNDQYHSFVKKNMSLLRAPFYSCEAVITESFFLMSRIPTGVDKLIELLEMQYILIQPVYSENQSSVHHLIQSYSNIPMSMADACLVQMMDQKKDSSIFTLDSDFQIYRSLKGERLQVIAPF